MTEKIIKVTVTHDNPSGEEYTWSEEGLKISLLKMNVLAHYGNGKLACIWCGYDDMRALTIDHIKGGGKAHRKLIGGGGYFTYRWLKKNGYPIGFQTLCMNCQWVKRLREMGHPNIKVVYP